MQLHRTFAYQKRGRVFESRSRQTYFMLYKPTDGSVRKKRPPCLVDFSKLISFFFRNQLCALPFIGIKQWHIDFFNRNIMLVIKQGTRIDPFFNSWKIRIWRNNIMKNGYWIGNRSNYRKSKLASERTWIFFYLGIVKNHSLGKSFFI